LTVAPTTPPCFALALVPHHPWPLSFGPTRPHSFQPHTCPLAPWPYHPASNTSLRPPFPCPWPSAPVPLASLFLPGARTPPSCPWAFWPPSLCPWPSCHTFTSGTLHMCLLCCPNPLGSNCEVSQHAFTIICLVCLGFNVVHNDFAIAALCPLLISGFAPNPCPLLVSGFTPNPCPLFPFLLGPCCPICLP